MEYHGKPVGGVSESGKPHCCGHGGANWMEPQYHPDHAEKDDREGPDLL